MGMFRKLPVEVEARQLDVDGSNAFTLADWCGGKARNSWSNRDREWSGIPHVDIETLEGTMTANPGDWIICGVAGEFYPCKPGVFAVTYEEV